MLQRTQILLDQEIKRDLVVLSRMKDQSISYVLRTILAEKLPAEKRAYRKKNRDGVAVMLQMAESTKKHKLKGPKDLSKNHDDYLYGVSSVS